MNNIKTALIKNGALVAATCGGLLGIPRAWAVTPIEAPTVTQIPSMEVGGLIGVLENVGGYLLMFGGVLAVLFLIYGGIVYITGGPKGEESAKKIIMNAIIGLIVMALSYVIAQFALTVIGA